MINQVFYQEFEDWLKSVSKELANEDSNYLANCNHCSNLKKVKFVVIKKLQWGENGWEELVQGINMKPEFYCSFECMKKEVGERLNKDSKLK